MSWIAAAIIGGGALMGGGTYLASKKKGEGVKSQVFEDPYKTKISSPLSTYLEQQIGKGLPRYEGDLYDPLDKDTMNRYSEFMSMDAGEWFDKAVGDPETKRFKEDLLPIITEGYAGSLRGSGRFKEEEAGIGRFSEYLAGERYKAMRDIPQEQFKMGIAKSSYTTMGKQAEYQDWMKSLPENNPALAKALQFLAGPTGRDELAWYDPGKAPWYADWMKGMGSILMSVGMSGGMSGGGAGAGTGGGGTPSGSAYEGLSFTSVRP